MFHRSHIVPFALSAALALAACGGSDDSSGDSATDDSSAETAVEAAPEPESTPEAPPTEVAEEPALADATVVDDGGAAEPCGEILTADEIESALGTPVVLSGGDTQCTVNFASDAVGNLSGWSGSRADEAMSTLLPMFEADPVAMESGVLLDDGRGFIDEWSIVAQGDSGMVYRFDVPENVEVADLQASMQSLADLLLAR